MQINSEQDCQSPFLQQQQEPQEQSLTNNTAKKQHFSVRTTKKEKENYHDRNTQFLQELRMNKIKQAEEREKSQKRKQMIKEKLRKKVLEDASKARMYKQQDPQTKGRRPAVESLPKVREANDGQKGGEYKQRYLSFLLSLNQMNKQKKLKDEHERLKKQNKYKKLKEQMGFDRIQSKLGHIFTEKPPRPENEETSKSNIQRTRQYMDNLKKKKHQKQSKQAQEVQRQLNMREKLKEFVLTTVKKNAMEGVYDDEIGKKRRVKVKQEDIREQEQQEFSPNQFKQQSSEQEDQEKPKQKKRKMRDFPFIVDLAEWKRKNRIQDSTKVFIITGGYPDLKRALKSRGWVQNPNACSPCFDLKFTLQSKQLDFNNLHEFQMVNHFKKNNCITTKVGLCHSLKNVIWNTSQDINQFYPRCYDLNFQEETAAFIQQFKICKCISILKKYIRLQKIGKIDSALSSKVKISIQVLKRKNIQLDQLIDIKKQPPLISQKQWNELIDDQITAEQIAKKKYQAYLAQVEGKPQKKKKKKKKQVQSKQAQPQTDSLIVQIQKVLDNFKDPQLDLAGQHNIWILKPAGLSRGRGILCLNTLVEIQDHIAYRQTWVIQKYIQNPLIVLGRKFDIRLWVLATDFNPLTIWIYNQCYIRFGSVDYDAKEFSNKFQHLTNNSINAKNKNADETIKGNMWTQDQFIQHLISIQGHNIFMQKIQPQMQRIVKVSLESAQDSIESRRTTHQVFGYDFMIDQDYRVWLIQVNSSPAMDYSTHVTKDLVKLCMTDLPKVIIDWQYASKKQRKGIDTGGFRRIFKGVQLHQRGTTTVGLNLMLQGKGLKKSSRTAAKINNLTLNATK